MMGKILTFAIIISALVLPGLVSAQSNEASYRYNRISAEYRIQRDGSVRVVEMLTMLYNGQYHSMWRSIPFATSTAVSDVKVFDGSTGQQLTLTSGALQGEEPQNWGKYVVETDEAGDTNVEWFYGTQDRVHTWVLTYTLRGVITFYDDRDEFFWNILANYDVSVDTVESQVFLPGAITMPHAQIFTTGNHDWYMDRPDSATYRFRVSDITPGERVSIQTGWQKGLVAPKLAVPFTWRPEVRYVIAGGVVLAVLVFISGLYMYRRILARWCSSTTTAVRTFAKDFYKQVLSHFSKS